MDQGLVSFVGLGPGDPALRASRVSERLGRADLVVNDGDGVSPARLVELARDGKRVVRAFAGDALESPEALAEVREVARAGVAFEVVPGVGARATASAFAGVLGRAVRGTAGAVAPMVQGESPATPVTLLVDAGLASQRVVVTTVEEAASRLQGMGDRSIIVAFGIPDESLRWFERLPLFGKRVLVPRARQQAIETAALLREHGAEPILVPTIDIGPPSDPAPLERCLAELRAGRYEWVAFTSANGVEHTWEAVVRAGADARAFGASRLAAIGPATARALERHGLRADVIAKEFRGEGLAEEILRAIGSSSSPETGSRGPLRVLLSRAAKARDALPDALRAAGCRVDVVAAYETRPPPTDSVRILEETFERGRVDAVVFTSSSTVDNFCDLVGQTRAAAWLAPLRVASIGPVTTETARSRGLRVDVTAAEFTVPGLIRALSLSWPDHRGRST